MSQLSLVKFHIEFMDILEKDIKTLNQYYIHKIVFTIEKIQETLHFLFISFSLDKVRNSPTTKFITSIMHLIYQH